MSLATDREKLIRLLHGHPIVLRVGCDGFQLLMPGTRLAGRLVGTAKAAIVDLKRSANITGAEFEISTLFADEKMLCLVEEIPAFANERGSGAFPESCSGISGHQK